MEYSIVIPLKDEEKNISPLIHEIEEVMLALHKPFELILINDASLDGTLLELQKFQTTKSYLRVMNLKKTSGQSGALLAGFKAARAPIIITMDGDLQNDPKDIPQLLNELQYCDMVCGIRKNRKDTLIKKWTSKLGRAARQLLLQDGIKDTGCSLKVYKKNCLECLPQFNGMHRFFPALFQIAGFKVKQVEVNHRERSSGKTKYSFRNRSLNTFFDLLAVRWLKNRRIMIDLDREIY
jgi:dolichol-phosphate mannosyltransferase